MSHLQHYNHKNVPEDVAKRFPQFKGKVFGSVEVPQHVLDSVQRHGNQPLIQSRSNYVSNVPLVAGSIGAPVLGCSVFGSQIGVGASQLATTGYSSLGNSHVYTQADVPEEVLKRFPNLQQRFPKKN